MDKQVELASERVPHLGEDPCDVLVGADVALRDERRVDRGGQLAHRRFDAISLVREGQARPAGRELPRDRPRDRALVGNTEDEAPLAFERSGHAPILER